MGSYKGTAVHQKESRLKETGTLTVQNSQLKFYNQHREYSFFIHELKVWNGGASKRLIFFSHPSLSDWTFYTPQSKILKHEGFQNHAQAVYVLNSIHTHLHHKVIISMSIVLLLLGGIWFFPVFKSFLSKKAVDQVPKKWNQKIGTFQFKSLKETTSIIQSEKVNQLVNILSKPLINVLPSKHFSYQFHILNKDSINAFALTGGHIVLHKGLILAADHSEEVLAVMAHEVGHVMHRHVLRKVFDDMFTRLFLEFFMGDTQAFLHSMESISYEVVQKRFSRELEKEADMAAFQYLLRANVHPKFLIQFLKKIKKNQKYTIPFLSTHPVPSQRIHYIQEKIRSERLKRSFKNLSFSLDPLKNKIKSID